MADLLFLVLLMTLLCGVVYPLGIWAVSRLPGLSDRAEGSVVAGGAGSSLIGIDPVATDPAADPWFHTRPSASSEGALGPADTTTSGGSNLGGFSSDLVAVVQEQTRRRSRPARASTRPPFRRTR